MKEIWPQARMLHSNIDSNLGYLLGNSPSDQNNTDQLLFANSNVRLQYKLEIGYVYQNSQADGA